MVFAVVLIVIGVLSIIGWKNVFRWFIPSKRHVKCIKKAAQVKDLLTSGIFSPGQAINYLRKINPYVFEELVLTGFEERGYKIIRNKRYSGDGGMDGMVIRNGEEFLVQSKRYTGYISNAHVEAFSRLCTRRCRKGFFVHTGKTGGKSKDVVSYFGNVDIISGDRLLALIGFQQINDYES